MGGQVIYTEIDRIFDEARKQGIEQGIEQGVLTSIKNLMNNMDISAEQAMDYLGIDETDRQKYFDKIL